MSEKEGFNPQRSASAIQPTRELIGSAIRQSEEQHRALWSRLRGPCAAVEMQRVMDRGHERFAVGAGYVGQRRGQRVILAGAESGKKHFSAIAWYCVMAHRGPLKAGIRARPTINPSANWLNNEVAAPERIEQ